MTDGEVDPRKAMAALAALDTLFTDPTTGEVNFQRRLTGMRRYRGLAIRVAADSLSPEQGFITVRNGLMADALVDPNDPELAAQQTRTIEDAYTSAPEMWDKWTGRQRRYQQNIADLG